MSQSWVNFSELNFYATLSHSKQLLKHIHPMMLASFCSLMKIIFAVAIRETHRITDCTHIHKPKTPAHTISVQSLMTSVDESQVVDITPVWYLSVTESRLVRSTHRNVTRLQQFLPAIRQISSEYPLWNINIKKATTSNVIIRCWICYLHSLSAGQFPSAQGALSNQLFPHNCQMLSNFKSLFEIRLNSECVTK